MARIYRYIHVSDTGMAPCNDGGRITLATCKPSVRRTAGIGDWVAGFMPSPHPRGLVTWAGRVERIVAVDRYDAAYGGRPDAYRAVGGGLRPVTRGYHPEAKQQDKDRSAPVLIFDANASWYFGATPRLLPTELLHLAAAGQGHRVKGVVEGDERKLMAWLKCLAPPGILGPPRDPLILDRAKGCGRSRRFVQQSPREVPARC